MRRTKLFCAVVCILLVGGVVSAIDYGISCPDHLYVKSVFGMSNEQQVLLQSLQGIVAQTKPEIFIEAPGNTLWLNDLESAYGVTHEDQNDLAWYLNHFSSHYNGYLLYDYTDLASLNVASALAGARKAIAVDVTLESWVQSLGLTLNEDVRTRDEPWLYNNYWGFFRHDLIIGNNGPYMHDLAPAINGFSSYSSNAVFADTLYNSLETETAQYFGWIDPSLGSHDESLQVTYHSKYGLDTNGSGLNYNFSTYAGMASKSPEIELKQPASDNEYSSEENVHYVTFYMSDMGNLAFLPSADGWAENVNHYGHPRRGEFGMGWGTSQLAVDLIPNIMDWWYRNATENDSFVASSYIFPSDHPNLDAYTKQLDEDMRKADLGTVFIYDDLNDEAWDFESIEYEPYLRKFAEMQSFRGGIYAEYFPYYAYDGRVRWVDGKPFVNIKYVMDEGNDDGLSLASKINALPTDVHDEASYSMVLVNAWGFGGVLMPQVCDAVDNFDSNVRVVTPHEFFERLYLNIPYSSKASSRSQFNTPEEKCYDGSGMTGNAHNNNYSDMWLSGADGSTGWIKFNLGDTYQLDLIEVWNYNQDGETRRGVNEADIYWSNSMSEPDGGGTFNATNWNLKETKFFNQALGTDNYNTPDYIDMDGIRARWIAVDIKSNFGDSGYNDVGLSEVKFYGLKDYSVKASSRSQFTTPEIKCYDDSGMTGDAHNNYYADMWLSGTDDSTGWIKFNLGDTSQLDLIKVWNYNQDGETRRGVNEADIYWSSYSTDPDNGGAFDPSNWNFQETKFFTEAPGTNGYSTPDSINMVGVNAKWVAINIKSNFGDSGFNDVGLSEVKFYGPKDFSVKASSRSQFNAPEEKCYDGSGMTGDAHNNYYADMWLSGADDSTGWIKFNLGDTYQLDLMKVWNYNQDGETRRGVNEADIYWSSYRTDPDNGGAFDPSNWNFQETKFFTEAPGTNGYSAPDSINMVGINAKWVAIDIKSNFGDSGFNDVGLSEVRFVIESDAPTPNPATFATVPYATDTDSITMVATTGSDVSGPVEYLFVETSGNPGGSSSSWQTSTSYSDTGLDPSTQYTYTVTMRDAIGNTGTASSPASATTLASPVVHLPFDESTGTTAGDLSSYNNNGTVMNTTFDVASVSGQIGNALLFDGTDDYVHIPDDASLNPTDKVTVSAWIKADAWQTYHWGGSIVSKDEWSAGGRGYVLRCGNSGRLSFAVGGIDGGWKEALSGQVMSTGTWYYVVGTYDGSTVKVYINGTEAASTPATGAIAANTLPINIGRGTYDTTRLFDGVIDDVRIYTHALVPDDFDHPIPNSATFASAPANAIYIADPGTEPTALLMSIGSSSSNVLVGAINMTAGAIYTLQGAESLTVTNWVDLGTTTGVSSVEWTVPATNDVQFFRVSGE